MTKDEIIKMAMEAEFVSRGKPSEEESELFVCIDKDIYKFANLVAEKEREECAKLCKEMAVKDNLTNYYKVAANAIRAKEQE